MKLSIYPILLLSLLFQACGFNGNEYHVSPNGNDANEGTEQAQFKGLDPNNEEVEINVRQSIFYPKETGINYLTVKDFTMEHAATPWSPPTAEQIGLIGTHWGKGWIIENNTIRYSTCVGITLGKQYCLAGWTEMYT